MTTAFAHAGPWTEEDYLALEETSNRVELFDGSLHVTPAPTPRHQRISRRLATILERGAIQVGLDVHEAVNVRLKAGLLPIPDIVITSDIDLDDPIVPVRTVKLVCEIVSPSNAAADKILKMYYYAAAGIEWYLLVEQDAAALHLYRLDGRTYREHSVTRAGEVLRLAEPLPVEIDPTLLMR